MYKILFISALVPELKIVKNEIKKFTLKWVCVSFFAHGIWNYNTILNLTSHLKDNDYDFIVSIWVCGYKDEKNDVIQIARTYNLSNKKELLVPIILEIYDLESIVCSELPVFDIELLENENYVDMESYWVEKVCDNFKIPRIILKIPVDKIWDETKNFDFNLAKILLASNINYNMFLNKIIIYLDSLDKKEDLSIYFEYYKFTFSEKIIFNNLYYKYSSIIWEDFLNFFNENKILDKDRFLNLLKKYFNIKL